MPSDNLLPYPLAGADSRQSASGAGPGSADADERGPARARRRGWQAPAVATLIAALLAGLLWTAGQWRAERATNDALRTDLAAEQSARQQAESAAQDAISDPLTVGQVSSAEMYVASAGVDRFIESVSAQPAGADARVFTRAFFGIEIRTRGWIALPSSTSSTGTTGVLGKLDDPQQPTTVWVTRKSAQTLDPAAPSRDNCLRLDIDRIVESVRSARQWGRAADTAPLRWWSDVYDFVPAMDCGV